MSFMFLFPTVNFISILTLNLFEFDSCHWINSALMHVTIFAGCCGIKMLMLTANTVANQPQLLLGIYDDYLHVI